MPDVHEIVRRLRLHDGIRKIARDLSVSRVAVRGYRDLAAEEGWLDRSELPSHAEIHQRLLEITPPVTTGPTSKADAFRETIQTLRKKSVEVKALHELLREKGYSGSYSALVRYVSRIEGGTPETFVRIETAPAEEAQIDFGYAGLVRDPVSGIARKAWVFVMTLCFSRHLYAELVFGQSIETWIALHVRAFEWFGGVPKRLVIDNLKAAIVHAAVYDAAATRSYRELATHYGTLISPCPPRTPRLKGKVESAVHYVKRNALAGREFADLAVANDHLRRWTLETAGRRDHGTTHEQPLIRFERERGELLSLPTMRYEPTVWKQVLLHRDGYVVFDYAYYSAPYRLVGKLLWLAATPTCVVLFDEHVRIASHSRATRRGQRQTAAEHLPPFKAEGISPDAQRIREEAAGVGPATNEFVDRLLGDRAMDRLRGAQAVLRLGRRAGAKRLEAACRRALAFDEIRYHAVRTILKKGLDTEPLEGALAEAIPGPKTAVFARPMSDFIRISSN